MNSFAIKNFAIAIIFQRCSKKLIINVTHCKIYKRLKKTSFNTSGDFSGGLAGEDAAELLSSDGSEPRTSSVLPGFAETKPGLQRSNLTGSYIISPMVLIREESATRILKLPDRSLVGGREPGLGGTSFWRGGKEIVSPFSASL